ncbi:helix-turn-helix transcriptional regulator [Ethanoligenens harbinense]|nr:XRE family transcriptional regulator [Ethanoligenens harbinense YUAN-3]AYF38599.1 XRE family transcriptional regulator [Ethanoligenens harbinense]AYF41345.1 XRE family transcriptional regulator [Ethanoligenens harbinense]QCN92178.1 XRE family transcriptional regulator [Ethanoligenens harbinense]
MMGLRIRALREDRDLNQQALADLLNISQTTYSRYIGQR